MIRSTVYRVAALALVAAVSGCRSERIEVQGRIARPDGSPVAGARVIFRSPETGETASGVTDEQGRYVLGTSAVGEGILPGEYQVAVREDRGDWDSPRPRTIHPGYGDPTTSRLAFKAERGGETVFDIVVKPVRGS